MILDNFKEDQNLDGWYIPSLTKYKPNDVTGLNGNAFALKLNVKFNTSLDNVGVEKSINDFTTFSMDIFLDTSAALDQATKLLMAANLRYDGIAQKVQELESLLLTTTQVGEFGSRLTELETLVVDAKLNYANSSSLLGLIQSTNKRINQLLDGTVPSSVQYNIDVIKQGDGTEIDKSAPGLLTLKNKVYGYDIVDAYNFDVSGTSSSNWQVGSKISVANLFNAGTASSTALWVRFKNYTNRINLWLDNTSPLNSDINIYIDDSITTWKKGHVLKFNFKSNFLPNGKRIKFFTDKNGTNGWKQIGLINESEILNSKPYIEIICVDEINKSFEIDILR